MSNNEKEKVYEHDPLEKLHKQVGLLFAQLEGLKQGVSHELAQLSGLIGHAATRVEQVIYTLEQGNVLTEEQMQLAYMKLQDHRLHLERILSDTLPMEEKIKEVLAWNQDFANVKMDMQQIGLQGYLMENPDNLSDDDRIRLAKMAELEEIELQMLETHMSREKLQPAAGDGPRAVDKE